MWKRILTGVCVTLLAFTMGSVLVGCEDIEDPPPPPPEQPQEWPLPEQPPEQPEE